MPNLTRGPEQELDTIRDMEALRANMVNMKIHADGNKIRDAFLFKRDVDVITTGGPPIIDSIMQTSVRKTVETVTKKAVKKKKMMK